MLLASADVPGRGRLHDEPKECLYRRLDDKGSSHNNDEEEDGDDDEQEGLRGT